jgi:hypothetical protein
MSRRRLCNHCKQEKNESSFRPGKDMCGRCRSKHGKKDEMPFFHPILESFARHKPKSYPPSSRPRTLGGTDDAGGLTTGLLGG